MLSIDFCDNITNKQLIIDGNVDVYNNNDILDEWIINIQKFIDN
jgi:hypothetical protein